LQTDIPWTLPGKVILVTGGARRIGRAIALHLAAQGAQVLIHYLSSASEARRTARECEALRLAALNPDRDPQAALAPGPAWSGVEDPAALCFRADLTRVDEIAALFRQIEHGLGGLDALVNNAARFTRIDPLQVSEADWDFIHAVNLKGTFFCAQHAARLMLSAGRVGRIVNISSMGAFLAWAGHAHYCASKAGVVALTRALAKAWAPHITVNSVAPGVIAFEEADRPDIQRLARSTPARHPGTGADIAAAVEYFLTATGFVTGQTLQVDGGMGLR
jgi:3-oxoacyl-[acyl-carrier protein] reductase/pteridine reductase